MIVQQERRFTDNYFPWRSDCVEWQEIESGVVKVEKRESE